jgi:hypothetical protein
MGQLWKAYAQPQVLDSDALPNELLERHIDALIAMQKMGW